MARPYHVFEHLFYVAYGGYGALNILVSEGVVDAGTRCGGIMLDVTDQLSRRLAEAASSRDVDWLLDLGCDLAGAGRQADAEGCFRRAAELGSAVALFNLGNALQELGRLVEAAAAYEAAAAAGETDAYRNLGHVLVELGDLAGAIGAYPSALAAGDGDAALALAFELREQGDGDDAEEVLQQAALAGDLEAAGVLVCWRWCRTLDPALEPDLRAGADHFPAARADLADLLSRTGRTAEAQQVLERGAKLGESESLLPLGNLYADIVGDVDAAEDAYRAGIAAGDNNCHNNLGLLLWHQRGDLNGAERQFRGGAEAGDALAARHLRELLEEERGGGDEVD